MLLVVVLLLMSFSFYLTPFVVASELRLLFGRPLAVAFGLKPLLYLLDLLPSPSFGRSLLNSM